MEVGKLQAALIRAFWTVIMPAAGLGIDRLIAWWSTSGNPESIGVDNMALAFAIGAILYGAKKFYWPSTKW